MRSAAAAILGGLMLAGVATLVLGLFPGLVSDISNFAPSVAALGG